MSDKKKDLEFYTYKPPKLPNENKLTVKNYDEITFTENMHFIFKGSMTITINGNKFVLDEKVIKKILELVDKKIEE